MNEPLPLLNTAEAARRLGSNILPRTLEQWRYLGRGPKYLKLGQRVAYRPSDLDAWLDSQTRDPERDGRAAS